MPLGTEVELGEYEIVLVSWSLTSLFNEIVLNGGQLPPSEKGARHPSPIFGPRLLLPNGRSSQLLLSSCS